MKSTLLWSCRFWDSGQRIFATRGFGYGSEINASGSNWTSSQRSYNWLFCATVEGIHTEHLTEVDKLGPRRVLSNYLDHINMLLKKYLVQRYLWKLGIPYPECYIRQDEGPFVLIQSVHVKTALMIYKKPSLQKIFHGVNDTKTSTNFQSRHLVRHNVRNHQCQICENCL